MDTGLTSRPAHPRPGCSQPSKPARLTAAGRATTPPARRGLAHRRTDGLAGALPAPDHPLFSGLLDGLRIVQFTPPGSGASSTFGLGLTTAAPGSAEGGLTVSDIEAAHDELTRRGIDASEIWHGPPFPPEARQPGPDPERTSYGSFFSFTDPDGNTWLVQEVTTRLPGRIDTAGTAFAFTADLASALRRAEAAHGEHEKRTGASVQGRAGARRELAQLVRLVSDRGAGRDGPADLTEFAQAPAAAGAAAGARGQEGNGSSVSGG